MEASPTIAILPIIFFLAFAAIGVGVFAFWLWMLIDCVSNEPAEGNDKIVWILVIVLTGIIGAAIYFFIRRPQRKAQFGR